MRARRSVPALIGTLAMIATIGALAPPAFAGCHAFEVDAPSRVREGDDVTVTVTRDNDLAPSAIELTVIEGTAKEGKDYEAREKYEIEFEEGTSKRVTIETVEDETSEEDETFRLHLQDPSGCSVNPSYSVGEDATVTIRDDDEAAPATTPPATTPATTPPTTAAPTTTAPTPTETFTTVAAGEEDGGLSAGVIVAIVAAVLVAAALGAQLLRRRSSA